jgi:hypothetical protein
VARASRATALVALTVGFTLPGTASAAVFAGVTSEGDPIVIEISKDGRQVKRASTAMTYRCSNGFSGPARFVTPPTPLSARGKFSLRWRGVRGTAGDGTRYSDTGFVSGTLDVRRGVVHGQWKETETGTHSDGAKYDCTTSTIRFTASGHPKGKPRQAGYYGAFGGRLEVPLVVKVSDDGRRVQSLLAALRLDCSDGGYYDWIDEWNPTPLSASGRFGVSVADYEGNFSDGSTYRITATVTGTIDHPGKTARGTWALRLDIPNADGTTTVCDSGTVHFAGRR